MPERKSMRKITFAALSLVFVMLATLPLIQYVDAANIYTAKEDGTITSTFEMNDKVRIIGNSLSILFEIIITDPEGVIRYRETVRTPGATYDKVLSGITDIPGWWKIEMHETGEIKPLGDVTSIGYLTSFDNVTPEVPLGTLSILVAFFAAFAICVFRKRSNPEISM
jgi:hypothetical protein